MRKCGLCAALVATVVLGAGAAAQAAGTPLSIQSGVNSNLYTYTNGTNYPPAGSTVTIGGVDFTLADWYPPSFGAPDVGVVQSGNGAPTSITIQLPAVTVGASTVFYSLINSAFGTAPNTIGNLTLNFQGGGSFVYDLTEGDNVRDHYNGIYNNSAPNVYGTASYSGDVRLDAQQITLPGADIGLVLRSITLNNTDTADGNPFLAAFTVVDAASISAIPEPSTWTLMLFGVGMAGASLRMSRRKPAAAATTA
jgi:hypothetical protein